MRHCLLKASLVAMISLAAVAQGDELPQSKAEYSADFKVHATTPTGTQQMQGRLFSAPGKERSEFQAPDGSTQTTILRKDKGVLWNLLPGNAYIESPVENSSSGIPGGAASSKDVHITQIGTDTVNGIPATKEEIQATGAAGETLQGFVWLSKEDILVQMQGDMVHQGQKISFKRELSNLKLEKQKPSLFDLPAAARRLELQKPAQAAPAGSAKPAQKPNGQPSLAKPEPQPKH